jgi:predicted permease
MTFDRMRQIVRLRLRSLFAGAAVDAELDEELRYHLAQQIDANIARGMTPEAARTAALRAIGGIEQRKEECRDTRGLTAYERVVGDTRYATRVLRRSPVFAFVAIASLAFGIGAFLAMFQLVDAVQLRTLPVADAHELVDVRIDGGRGGWGLSETAAEITQPLWQEIRAHQSMLSEVFAWGRAAFLMGDGVDALPVRGLYVSGEAFSTLRLRPASGRLFGTGDDQPGCEGAVVLSHAFWQSRFGGDRSVIGMPITLLQQRLTIIGVAPPQFTGLEVGRSFDVALPICTAARIGPSYARRDFWWLNVMGRLPHGVTLSQAGAHLQSISPGLIEATLPPGHDQTSLDTYRSFRFTAVSASRGVSRLRAAYQSPLWLLLGTTGLILLLTVANLATLMLARAHARRRELAMLVALGASRSRLISQIVIESLLLSAAGVALAFPLALAAGRVLVRSLSTDIDPLYVPLAIDWRAASVAAAVVAITALVFGLLPALQSLRFDPLAVLRSGGRTQTLDRGRAAVQRGLVVGQLAICFVLVVSAMLFVRSMQNIATTDIGFNADGLKVVGFGDPNMHRLPMERKRAFQDALIEAIGSIPGVRSAGSASQVPLSGASWTQGFHLRGGAERLSAKFTYVSPGFFQTLQMPIHDGRGFEPSDTAQSRPVAIVNDAFARRFLARGAGITAAIETTMEANYPSIVYDVVGKVGNIKYGDVREDDLPIVYVPLAQSPVLSSWKSVIVRTNLTAGAIAEASRSKVKALNADIWVRVTDVREQLDQRLVRERMLAWLAGIFGLLAVGLAAIGLYGLVTYVALGRRSEIGVRLALGASRGSVLLTMLRESAWLAGAGLVVGVLVSIPLSRTAARLLFQLAPTDTATWVGAALVLLSVAAVAAIVPAWRTASLDPLTTLRAEQS